MLKAAGIAVAVALAGALPGAHGETAALAAPAGAAPAAQDCWIEHTQVQPPPGRQGNPDDPPTTTALLMKVPRLGAEHVTAAQQKPCTAKPARPAPEAETTLPRSLAQ